MSQAEALVIDNIGSLVTNDPTLGEGGLGIVENASLVIAGGAVEEIGPAGMVADDRIDADGCCVLPGFVDSHTHLVFAGDRAQEFSARMAGQPYDGGGIRVTTDATRAASTEELHRLTTRRLAEAHRAGTTTIEIKSGYGLNITDEVRSLEIAETYTDDATFLGAHLLPAEFEGEPTTTSISSATRCSPSRRPTPGGSTRSASGVRSTPTSVERCSRRGRPPGWGPGCTATSSAPGPECSWRWSVAVPRSITAPTSPMTTSRHSPAARPSPPSFPPPTSRPASRIPTLAASSTRA